MKLTAKIKGKITEIEVGNLFPEFCHHNCKGCDNNKPRYCSVFNVELDSYRNTSINCNCANLRCNECIRILGGIK